MSSITFEEVQTKYDSCVAALDSNKFCSTCRFRTSNRAEEPCCKCYIIVFGFPVNPTEWKAERKAGE